MDREIQFKFFWVDKKLFIFSTMSIEFNEIGASNSDSVGNMMGRLLKTFRTCNYRISIIPLFIGEELQ
ncbi:hypothetical protein [Bacillus cereus]|uniref:hypothetical protein n=1 Tax=Bacillus cereus TaxID=1396 RepID=UPI0015D4D4E6|nr:hypothetical protein [Bacillus cereus]